MEQEHQQGVLGGILEEGTILVISCISLSIHAVKLSKIILKHMLEMATGPRSESTRLNSSHRIASRMPSSA